MSSKVLPNCGIINWLFPQQTIYAVKKNPTWIIEIMIEKFIL